MIQKRRRIDGTAEANESELKSLFVRLDLDGSGTVDLSEYVQWALREALRESKGRVMDLFREWDKDRSNCIDKDEFAQALFSMGFECNKNDINRIWKDLDPDGSNQLDYRELNACLRRSLARKNPSPTVIGGAKKRTPPSSRPSSGRSTRS